MAGWGSTACPSSSVKVHDTMPSSISFSVADSLSHTPNIEPARLTA